MPKFKKNPSPAMKRSGFKMKGYSYPGTSPIQKIPVVRTNLITEHAPPKAPKTNQTVRGVTGFEYDFPIVSKLVQLTNPVSTTKRKIKNVKKISNDIVSKGKKVYNYFTKK